MFIGCQFWSACSDSDQFSLDECTATPFPCYKQYHFHILFLPDNPDNISVKTLLKLKCLLGWVLLSTWKNVTSSAMLSLIYVKPL